MTIIEKKCLKTELRTEFEIKLQLTSFNSSCRLSVQNRKMSLKIKLNYLRTNKSSFLCLGTSKTLSLGEFDDS